VRDGQVVGTFDGIHEALNSTPYDDIARMGVPCVGVEGQVLFLHLFLM